MRDFLFIKTERIYFKLKFSDILYVNANKKYTTITTNSKSYFALVSIGQIEKILPKNSFCRIHRSFIVSMENIIQFDNDLVYIGTRKLPISESYKKPFRKSLIILSGKIAGTKLQTAMS